MQIIKKVLIKQVITEKSKAVISERLEQEKAKLDLECQQLLFEQRKLMNKMQHSKQELEHRFGQEIKKRKDRMSLVDFRMEQLSTLDIGAEVIEKEVDALVNIEIGTSWDEIMKEQSIIIKDGAVVRIDYE